MVLSLESYIMNPKMSISLVTLKNIRAQSQWRLMSKLKISRS